MSFYQIEPNTLIDLYKNYLSYRPKKAAVLKRFEPSGADSIETALLNHVYSTAAARMIYARVPEPIPKETDEIGLARYWKTYWNTTLGKGTTTSFLKSWAYHVKEGKNVDPSS